MKTIGILGCGWLGLPLALKLQEQGYQVKGTTTTENKLGFLKEAGIEPFLLKVLPTGVEGEISAFLRDVTTLVVDFPPGIRRQPATAYLSSMQHLAAALRASAIKNLLFISSISVYEDAETFPVFTEADEPNALSERGGVLAEVEKLLQAENTYRTTLLRLGGLIGPERHPINQLAGRKGIANGKAPVNLIHLDDCIGIILKILGQDAFPEVFNGVHPDHPSKEHYYQSTAKLKDLPLPEFEKDSSKGKIIASSKVQEVLGYQFKGTIFP